MTAIALMPKERNTENQHIVARCLWQTSFDGERSQAHQLQDVLSHFSHYKLPSLLELYFNRYCPQGLCWTIDSLELDLGCIDYDNLSDELPKRLAEAVSLQLMGQLQKAEYYLSDDELQSALFNQLTHSRLSHSRLIAQQQNWQEYLRYYLVLGVNPWWYKQNKDSRWVVAKALQAQPKSLAALIRQVGQNSNVRKRIVWQYYPNPLDEVIKALEPYHHQSVTDFAERFIELQQQKPMGGEQQSLSRHTWYWVLTHLLTERGSLFNTRAFVISTLEQMAHHHQIELKALAQNMLQIAKVMMSEHHQMPLFIKALVEAQDQLSNNTQITSTVHHSICDDWQLFEQCLNGKGFSGSQLHCAIAELFDSLIKQNTKQVALLLRRHGRLESVRNRLIDALDTLGLALVVSVLIPGEQDFVVSHVTQVNEAIEDRAAKPQRKMIWQVVLSFLLNDSTSYFNRRQFVEQTLQRFSQASGIDYGLLLDLLSMMPPGFQGSSERFEWLNIVCELKLKHDLQLNRQSKVNAEQDHRLNLYAVALGLYLDDNSSQNDSGLSAEKLFQILLYQAPKLLKERLNHGFKRASGARRWLWLLCGLVQSNDDQRLLQTIADDQNDWLILLLPYAGVNGFEVILTLLFEPGDSKTLIALAVEKLNQYSPDALNNLRGGLSALKLLLPELIFEKLAQCLKIQTKPETTKVEQLADWILALEHQQSSVQFIQWLSDKSSDQERDLLRYLAKGSTSSEVINSLLQHKQRLRPLNQWFNQLWPSQLPALEKMSQSIENDLVKSGVWRGNTASLRRLLEANIWLSIFDLMLCNQQDTSVFWQHLLGRLSKLNGIGFAVFKLNFYRANQSAKTTTDNDLWFERNFTEDRQNNEPILVDSHGRYLSYPLMAQVLAHWLRYGRAPSWFNSKPSLSLKGLVDDAKVFAPELIYQALQLINADLQVFRRLAQLIDYNALLTLINQCEPVLAGKTSALAKIFAALEQGVFSKIQQHLDKQSQSLLWHYTLRVWLEGNSNGWQGLKVQAVVQALYTQLCQRYPDKQAALLKTMNEPYAEYFTDSKGKGESLEALQQKLKPIELDEPWPEPAIDTLPIAISNAGLVILQSYFLPYLTRLELINGDEFIHQQARLDAVHYLQFLVTGHSQTDETHLPLNKILCGLPLSMPVQGGVEIPQEHIAMAQGLIAAVIDYWQAIGSSSLEGFRGNWLVRPGLLRQTDEQWELIVEKRPYDLLLDRLPLSFKLVSLPWMDKPLYVTWQT